MTRWARLWRRMTRMFDVDAVPVTVVDDMAPDPAGWSAGYADTAGTGYRTVARRLPLLIATSLRLAAEASKPRTIALLAVQTASSLAGAFSLYATTDVLAPLFGAGATPDRIRAALPSMVVVLVLTASRSLCDSPGQGVRAAARADDGRQGDDPAAGAVHARRVRGVRQGRLGGRLAACRARLDLGTEHAGRSLSRCCRALRRSPVWPGCSRCCIRCWCRCCCCRWCRAGGRLCAWHGWTTRSSCGGWKGGVGRTC